MKLSFLENFEEKFYFKTSHYFWHLLTGLGGLALVVGILILLWGLTPSFKPGVKKPKYPEPVEVTAEEIKLKIQPPVKPKEVIPTVKDTVAAIEQQPEVVEKIDPAEQAYLTAIDSMQQLLPQEKYRWESRGHWEQSWYRKKWIIDYYGISDRLKSIFKKVDAEKFASKKQLLDAYIALIALFPEDQRYSVLKSAIEYCKTDVTTSVSNVELLTASVPNFNTDKSDFLNKLATFGRKNPRDGRTFIEFVNNNITKFEPEIRTSMLTTLINSYYRHFNLIEKQREATDLFLGMLDSFEPADQSKALTEYYRLYVSKNYDREREVEQIESEYQSNLSHAQSVLSSKKSKKAEYRGLGLKAIGGSIIFIAFVALFLVVLSIQRNVKLLREGSSGK